MAMQQGQSSLFGKYAGQVVKAHQTAVSKEPEIFGSSLPPGINNGIARLVKCGIETITKEGDPNKGQKQFMMTAVCISPEVFDNVQCKGKQFRLSPPVPLFDTPNWKSGGSFLEHYERMLDHLRIFVGKDVWRESGYFDGETPQQIEANLLRCMKDLAEKGPYFNFNTRPGNKRRIEEKGGRFWVGANSYASKDEALEKNPNIDREPLPQINWNDLLPNYVEQSSGASAFTDQSGNGHTDETQPDPAVLTPDNEFQAPEGDEKEAILQAAEGAVAAGQEADLDELVANAPDDETARERLIDIAGGLGIDRETAENTDTWDDLKTMILAAQADDTPAANGEPEPPPIPKKGDTGRYQLLDAKGNPLKDKAKKPLPPVNVEVSTVNEQKQMLTLKNLEAGNKLIMDATGKKALQIPWDKLLPSE